MRAAHPAVAAFALLRVVTTSTDALATPWWLTDVTARYYVVGSFAGGIFAGWGVTYAHALRGPVVVDELGAPPPGLGTGPMVGAKAVVGRGFTVEGSFGLDFLVADRGETIDPPVASSYATAGVGWSF